MGPQKFIAANTTEALKLVRQQVGGDAMVLSTRDTAQGVEIVAISPEALSKLSQRQDDNVSAAAAKPVLSAVSPAAPGAWPAPDSQAPGFDLEPANTAPRTKAQPSTADMQVEQLLAEFSQVKQLLQTHLSARAWDDLQAQSSEKAEALRVLLNAGFSPQLCAELADGLMAQPATPDTRLVDRLQTLLEPKIQTLEPLSVFDPGGIFAFIGPTGVGKTTAIAKIAARCVLRYGRDQLALLTTDTFRIGAQEQLKVYAKIIGVPVVSLRDSDDLAAKLSSMGDRRVILLDTAGVSQRDIQMLEQSQLLHEGAPALKRILVMSSTTDLRTQEDVILMHQQAAQNEQTRALIAAIITKTDEAAQIGPVLDCLIRHQLPLMFLANGQRVPEDLSQANTAYLCHRALHPRVLSNRMEIPDEHIPLLMADQLNDWVKTS
ncbi:flagellar biosynthesis protein FlhF [Limnohabitans lacus]|uniref:Flagellar biosynthesis protein FlhF n=1 Tax=Limnohabitans lacus TaxID=3045173 RepID=A0ABT6X947_9BURK|nr:flagellar biosynthesis protein FlhF [Limnohabitans sp. HM2-2]MDI9234658.1 flagellar biosynthesis protein FlhF [Limnohabitans sp. HM2-2]